MCGIAGIYFFDKHKAAAEPSSVVEAMLTSIRHRGPDDSGTAAFSHACLGMTRLSIIDFSTGHQPMTTDDGRFTIVFNGEIYNFQKIRTELLKQGLNFKTHSDTEVILLGFTVWGEAVLDKLEGMFALAIYDKEQHKLFLARDRLGKKPFYFYQDNEKLIFASETQALRKLPHLKFTVNAQAYWDYLTYRYIPGDQTAMHEIQKLPAATRATVSSRGIETKRYWKIPDETHALHTKKNLVASFGKLFAESVKKRLVSDVPVGVMLSGGVDSCAVLYEAAKHQSIDSFHVFFNVGAAYNELDYAKIMATAAGSKLHTVEVSEHQFIERIAALSEITDEPISDLCSIPFKYICDLARSHVKVVLSGEGSDEVLAGYTLQEFYKRYVIFKALQNTPVVKNLFYTFGKSFLPPDKLNYLEILANDWPRHDNYNITYQADQAFKAALLDVSKTMPLDSSRVLKAHYDSVKHLDALNQMLHVISRDWLVENVLMKSDKVSMTSSLEMRCPFLDHHLVEFLFGLPGGAKVGFSGTKFESKILLRRYLAGKIPEVLLKRKKLGFPVPAYAFLGERYKEYVRAQLDDPSAYYTNFFDRNKMLALFDAALAENTGEETKQKHFLWTIANFEAWVKNK